PLEPARLSSLEGEHSSDEVARRSRFGHGPNFYDEIWGQAHPRPRRLALCELKAKDPAEHGCCYVDPAAAPLSAAVGVEGPPEDVFGKRLLLFEVREDHHDGRGEQGRA